MGVLSNKIPFVQFFWCDIFFAFYCEDCAGEQRYLVSKGIPTLPLLSQPNMKNARSEAPVIIHDHDVLLYHSPLFSIPLNFVFCLARVSIFLKVQFEK